MLKNICQVKVKDKNYCMNKYYKDLSINGNIKNVCKRHYNDYIIRNKNLVFFDRDNDIDKKYIDNNFANYTKKDPFELSNIDHIKIIKNNILKHFFYKDINIFIDEINEECTCNQRIDDDKNLNNNHINNCVWNILNIIKEYYNSQEDINDCNIEVNNNFTLFQFKFKFKNKDKPYSSSHQCVPNLPNAASSQTRS